MADLEWLTHSLFVDRVGELFEVRADSVPAATLILTETEVSDAPGGTSPEGEERRGFSLVFTGPHAPALPQAIYGLAHGELGSLELFLVPIGPDAAGMRYQAVFG